jgi:Holliday junction resolvase
MTKPPDDAARLIQEAITRLGWSADPAAIEAQIRGLNRGLPLEDEFSVLCAWLGRCELVHKLGHSQTPHETSRKYQVPDLLVAFRGKERVIPVLVEVKGKQERVLSLRPDYFDRLARYGELVRLPVLIAWRYHGMWALFDLNCLEHATTNRNISFSNAMAHNLLGVLGGDFCYSLHAGAGIHLRFRKLALEHVEAEADGFREEWHAVCDDVHFTGRDGHVFPDLSTSIQSLFLAWNLERCERHSAGRIDVDFVADASRETGVFAHTALVRLLCGSDLPADGGIDWRSLLTQSPVLQGCGAFFAATREAMDLGIVRTIIRPVPKSYPHFLEEA